MKKRKVPMRKDIVTGEMMPKRQLIRVVKNKEGEVSLDPTGKKSGRGAYIAVNVEIAKQAKKEKTFEKAFHVKLDDSFYDELVQYTDHLQARQALFGNDGK
ncbi:MAG: YlxR family protein [Candidatus Limosilactobacillus merdavium]|uniref:YlxR family protein n=1 Tax=Candidatus Limosilactobacillus merdavium TaxID=2838651 RepID=A0A9E2KT02_9LACO|nr:YlxR family protein [Candidatus Limosilactobacillus merdavium]